MILSCSCVLYEYQWSLEIVNSILILLPGRDRFKQWSRHLKPICIIGMVFNKELSYIGLGWIYEYGVVRSLIDVYIHV